MVSVCVSFKVAAGAGNAVDWLQSFSMRELRNLLYARLTPAVACLQGLSLGTQCGAPHLESNTYQLYTEYQAGAHGTDPTSTKRVKQGRMTRAHRKTCSMPCFLADRICNRGISHSASVKGHKYLALRHAARRKVGQPAAPMDFKKPMAPSLI